MKNKFCNRIKMGDDDQSYVTWIKNGVFDYFFKDDDGNLDINIDDIANGMDESSRKKVEKLLYREIMKRYGVKIVIVGTSVFCGGIFIGYLVFKPSKKKRKRINK